MSRVHAIVLAGGEGTRLASLTRDERGLVVPKQYCRFDRTSCMLRWALDRADALSSPERVVVVVSEHHRSFWEWELADRPAENVIVQPRGRGTAAGILLPLSHVLRRDADARVAVFPSDHFVADEGVYLRSMVRAVQAVERLPDRLALLGITPESAETGYGWILPGTRIEGAAHLVSGFVEKPEAVVAESLMASGALWNAFTFAASGKGLLDLYERTLPELHDALRPEALERERLVDVYARLPEADFSRNVLERAVDRLLVVPVPACGWTDLGTPSRLHRYLARHDA